MKEQLKEAIRKAAETTVTINGVETLLDFDTAATACEAICDNEMVEFAKFCDTEGFYPTSSGDWASAEYPG